MDERPQVVVVGGGFAGLAAARALGRAAVEVTVVDRHNHHVFQPLLYQVATAGLSPADIAAPIRWILRRQRNLRVVLGTVTAHRRRGPARDPRARRGRCRTTALVVATGVTHTYFGHDDWAAFAPGPQDARRRGRDPPPRAAGLRARRGRARSRRASASCSPSS